MWEHADCVSGSRQGGQPHVDVADVPEKQPEYSDFFPTSQNRPHWTG